MLFLIIPFPSFLYNFIRAQTNAGTKGRKLTCDLDIRKRLRRDFAVKHYALEDREKRYTTSNGEINTSDTRREIRPSVLG